jgi:PAS domain S-box-containing protein
MDFLLQAVDSCPSAFIVISSEGEIIETNKATAQLFGYNKEELIGLEVEKLIPPSLYKKHKDFVKGFFQNPGSRKMGGGRILEGRRKDGSRIFTEIGINFFEKDKKYFGVANIVDVTEEYKMRKLIDRTQEVAKIGSWHVDLSLNKCIWSKMTYQLHELDQNEEVFVEDAINFYAPEHRPVIQSCVEMAVSNGKSWDVELEIITTTGKRKWVRAIGSPVVENDEIIGIEGTFQDISTQKASDKKMESLTHRLTLAIQASKIGIWEWNLLTNELIWDQQMYNLYGIREEDFEGAYVAWENGLHPDDKEDSVKLIQKAIDGEANFDTGFRVVLPDGSIRFIRALASLDYNDAGEAIKMIGANWDHSEVKKNEKDMNTINSALEQANEELTQFAYRTSHDLKAPLTTIKSLARFMKEDLENKDYPEVDKNIDQVIRHSTRLENLVQDILSLAKADLKESTKENIKLKPFLVEMKERNKEILKLSEVEFQIDLDDEASLYTERIRLNQILVNLVLNAIKYSSPNREEKYVKISLKNEIHDILVIEDNGIGIPTEKHKDLFKMFTRFHPDHAEGSGLGMSIVKKSLDRIGGTVKFVSSDRGTTFELSIPKEK